MRRSETRVIDGTEYKVTCVDARTGVQMLEKIGAAIAGFSLAGASLGSQVAAALRAGIKAEELADVFGSQSWAGGQLLTDKVWPQHFAGRYDAFLEWLFFALEVNYANFTDVFPRLIERYGLDETETPSDEQR